MAVVLGSLEKAIPAAAAGETVTSDVQTVLKLPELALIYRVSAFS
jgi:hypothetical protein